MVHDSLSSGTSANSLVQSRGIELSSNEDSGSDEDDSDGDGGFMK